MANIVDFDSKGNYYYKGFLTSSEILEYEQLIQVLQTEIPQIETDLKTQYGDKIEYKYYLGKVLGDLLNKNEVSFKERRRFWDEIKKLASTEERTRSEGKNSNKRSFFEQCYKLSQLDYDVVKRLSWRQWQSLLDRDDKNMEDQRLYAWIKNYPSKIKEDEWREFLKILNFYLDEKDTSVFSDEEVFAEYDTMVMLAKVWLSQIKVFAKDNPKSKKLANKATWSLKFYKGCYLSYRKTKEKLTDNGCKVLFKEIVG